MCGIVGYVGKKDALRASLDGLEELGYRGYDSAGIAFQNGTPQIQLIRAVGGIENLRARILPSLEAEIAIAHTRWATHGKPTEENAHPHTDCTGSVYVVHNGIVENHRELRDALRSRHVFVSETDTEVLAHLIEDAKRDSPCLAEAVQRALRFVVGAYAIAVVDDAERGTLVGARRSSPLVIGVDGDGRFLASDSAAFLTRTREVVSLNDNEIAVLFHDRHIVLDAERHEQARVSEQVEWSVEAAQKGGHPHYMLKELIEAPEAIVNSCRGRLIPDEGQVKLGGLHPLEDVLAKARRLIILGCGSSYYAGSVGSYLIEQLAGVEARVELASEFRYRAPVLKTGDVVIAISQSGETADTRDALLEAKRWGIPSFAVTNVVGSQIARLAGAGLFQRVGPEKSVASTKAFLSQVTILTLLAIYLGRQREMAEAEAKRLVRGLEELPELMQKVLAQSEGLKALAEKYCRVKNALFLGRGLLLPVAMEGALKLKEISYIHAEGCGAGEMKHGPLALIDPDVLSVFLVPEYSLRGKSLGNLEEVRAREGPVLAIATEGDVAVASMADDVFFIPKAEPELLPVLVALPLQLFAYHMAVALGRDVDRPRNLAKSVTVE